MSWRARRGAVRRDVARAATLSLFAAAALAAGPAGATGAGQIVVEMSGFRNDRGQMRISLFRAAKGYPGDHRRAFRKGSARIVGKRARFVFDGVPHATYAISVLHDENGNKQMDTNWIGIPKEGGGASNDAKARFGPPKFADARFLFAARQLKLKIAIRYP